MEWRFIYELSILESTEWRNRIEPEFRVGSQASGTSTMYLFFLATVRCLRTQDTFPRSQSLVTCHTYSHVGFWPGMSPIEAPYGPWLGMSVVRNWRLVCHVLGFMKVQCLVACAVYRSNVAYLLFLCVEHHTWHMRLSKSHTHRNTFILYTRDQGTMSACKYINSVASLADWPAGDVAIPLIICDVMLA